MDSDDDGKGKRDVGDGERDSSIWSIRPRMRTAYLLTFGVLFGGSLAFLAVTGHGAATIMGLAGSVAIGSAGAAMFIAETGGYVMVFVDAAIAWRDGKFAERFRKGLDQGLEQGREQGLEQGLKQGLEQGIEQGRAEVRAELEAWYARMEDARARGEPFDEPPPGVNGHANSA